MIFNLNDISNQYIQHSLYHINITKFQSFQIVSDNALFAILGNLILKAKQYNKSTPNASSITIRTHRCGSRITLSLMPRTTCLCSINYSHVLFTCWKTLNHMLSPVSTSCCFFMCLTKAYFCRNSLGHKLHLYISSPVCILRCCLYTFDRINFFPQNSHWNGL